MCAGFRGAYRLPAIFLLVVLSVFIGAPVVNAGGSPTPVWDFELGVIADHLFDRDGRLSIDDVASPSLAAPFVPANGRPANYGPPPSTSAVLWLRVAVPVLPSTGENDWILSLKEVRIQTLELFVPDGAGWRDWRGTVTPAPARHRFRFAIRLSPSRRRKFPERPSICG